MPANAQALHDDYLEEIRSRGLHPSLLDRAKAWKHARNAVELPAAANDDIDLDAFIADLPCELDIVSSPVVTNLDGTPAELPAAIALPVSAPAPRLNRILVTKKGSARAPKTLLRDRENRVARMAYRRSAVTSATAPRTAPLAEHPTPTPANANTPSRPSDQTTSKTNSTSKTTTKGRGGRQKKSRARLHASWNDSGDLTRLDYVNRAGTLRGKPFAWTLNLSPDVANAANDNERGALDFLARRVRRHLDREPALNGVSLPLWIVIETTSAGRLHLHGGIFTDNAEALPGIMRALTKAGGAWGGTGGQHQVDLAPQRNLDHWAAYPVKRQALTRRHLRDAAGLAPDTPVSIATWSRELVADAKRLLEEERKAIGRT